MSDNLAFALMLPIRVVGWLLCALAAFVWLMWLACGLREIRLEWSSDELGFWVFLLLWVLSWYATIAGIGYIWRVYG